MRVITKQVSERFPVAFEYANRLPFGATLVSGVASAINLADSSVASATVLTSTTAVIDDTRAKVTVRAGTDDAEYVITVVVTLSDSSILEDEFRLKINNI